jgi:hypothetical protein
LLDETNERFDCVCSLFGTQLLITIEDRLVEQIDISWKQIEPVAYYNNSQLTHCGFSVSIEETAALEIF